MTVIDLKIQIEKKRLDILGKRQGVSPLTWRSLSSNTGTRTARVWDFRKDVVDKEFGKASRQQI